MNKYLTKISKLLSDENKSVARTFAETTAVGIPAHIIGASIGGGLGSKYIRDRVLSSPKALSGIMKPHYHLGGSNVGQFLGTAALGGIADIVAMKHSLHGNVKGSK
jgi:hypothetical protein